MRTTVRVLCIDKAPTHQFIIVRRGAALSLRRLREDPGAEQTLCDRFVVFTVWPSFGATCLTLLSEVRSVVRGGRPSVALSRRCFRCMNKELDGVVGRAQSVGGEQEGCLQ